MQIKWKTDIFSKYFIFQVDNPDWKSALLEFIHKAQ